MSVRRFAGDALVVATHNPGKAAEIADLLAPFTVKILTAGALGLTEPEETGTTFEANAALKALAAARGSGRPALADDSGLVVNALGGDPGVYSARWAGPTKDFALAMRKLQERLGDDPDRSAHFVAVLALAWPDGHVETCRGEVHGQLTWPPRGAKGFGYDPMFVAEGLTMTFGEIEPAAKHRISHRAVAFRRLVESCFAVPAA